MAADKNAIASVVVADGNAGYRSVLCELLRQMPGVRVVGECGDASAAVRLCERHTPDVLLIDSGMKGTDPFDAAEEARRVCPRTTIVFLTAGAAGQLRAAEYHRMADHVLSKSDIKASLRAVVESWRRARSHGKA